MDYLKAQKICQNLLSLIKEHHDYGQAYGRGTVFTNTISILRTEKHVIWNLLLVPLYYDQRIFETILFDHECQMF